MVTSSYDSYDTSERILYGAMPILGPFYLAIRYLGFRFNNERRDEVRAERQELTALVKDIQQEFSLAA